jgi:mono/diheme cytochrome c family protein
MKASQLIAFAIFILAGFGILIGCTVQANPPLGVVAQLQEAATATSRPAPSTPAAAATAPAGPELQGDMIRGGKLYDAWWTETAQDPPKDDMPLWKTQTSNTRKGSSTWRCAECHGYDYKGVDGIFASGSHKTGFKGILIDHGKPPADILAELKGKTNPAHDFSQVMEEQDLVDLALFVSKGTLDSAAILNPDGSPKGASADGTQKYNEVCAACHGPRGNAINFGGVKVEYLADPAGANPFQFLHRMRFGVAVWPMPSAIDNKFTDQELATVLAYAQTLSKQAKASVGGQLYDKWYAVLGVAAPTEDQPLWKTQTSNTRKGASTWSCRECHGIDYKGADGEFASGSHKTGFKGILSAQVKTESEIAEALNGKLNPAHDFSKYLDEASVKALTHFIKSEMVDFSGLIKDNKVTGDAAHGKIIFDQTCAQCHGKDGKLLNFKTPEAPEYVGTVAAEQSTTLMHRILFGVPGFPMPAYIDMDYSLQDLADVAAYSQTLPVK